MEATWFTEMFKIMRKICGGNIKEFGKNFSFIIFNYDRCVEHFIYLALEHYFDANHEEVQQCIKNIDIIHPYGIVAPLPWQEGENKFCFGGDCQATFDRYIDNIRTIPSERNIDKNDNEIDNIKSMMKNSSTIVFLGFGFDKSNMRLLQPKEMSATDNVIGTAKDSFEIHVLRKNIIEILARKDFNGNFYSSFLYQNSNLVELNNESCYELFIRRRSSLTK